MMSQKKRIGPDTTKNKNKMSNVSIFFRNLIKFCVFPLKADYQKRTLKFKFCAKEVLIYTIYVVLPIVGAVFPTYIIGYSQVMEYFTKLLARTTPTENLSTFGAFITFFVFAMYFITFLKKLGKQHHHFTKPKCIYFK